MNLLLDTTFLIDAERSGVHLSNYIADDDDVAIAAITVAELLVGVELATREAKPRRKRYVDSIISGIPVIPYGIGVAVE